MKKTDIADILVKPYARLVIPDNDGTFSAEIVEFPGCIAMGETAAEALENLDSVAADWISAAAEQGQDIPEPMDAAGYSGKLVLRMPKSLHQRAALYAERDGVSLNQFIVSGLAEQVGIRAQLNMVAAQSIQTISAPIMLLQLPALSQPTASYLGQFAASGSSVVTTPIQSDREFANA